MTFFRFKFRYLRLIFKIIYLYIILMAKHVRDQRQLRRTTGNLQKKTNAGWPYIVDFCLNENKFYWNLFAHVASSVFKHLL